MSTSRQTFSLRRIAEDSMDAATELLAKQTELAKRYHNSREVLEAEGYSKDKIEDLVCKMHDTETSLSEWNYIKRRLEQHKGKMRDLAARNAESDRNLEALNQEVQRYVEDVDALRGIVNDVGTVVRRTLAIHTEIEEQVAALSRRIAEMPEEKLRALDKKAIREKIQKLLI
ncbi:hypothetical protein FA95DRAFT_1564692 [Auriscalpium vulgare]|uniref:Uncharacterized protein n=1 Tax=Auriscalpium vulgare TaxID=40419 RepID=A0ACB8RD24_9AGAM|nr:hypothetical protein FA95DRAFT_1564692 [Auriscalpium vulgare]